MVDARTGQGLPCIDVTLSRLGEVNGKTQRTDVEGRFRAPWTSDRMMMDLRDGLASRPLGHLVITPEIEGGRDPAGMVRSADVGPTLVVSLLDAELAPEPWRLRILEPNGARYQFPWSWRTPTNVGEDLWVARYRKYEFPADPSCKAKIQIADSFERIFGEAAIDGNEGVHWVEIHVNPLSAWLAGRVIDEGGEPVYAELVVLHSSVRRGEEDKSVTTEEDGAWQLKSLEPGLTHIRVFSARRPSKRVEVELVPGENPPLEIVLPRSPPAGDVTGTLSAATGAPPRGIVLLESEDKQSPVRSLQWIGGIDNSDADLGFAFRDLPAGRYRLTCIGLDGREYLPRAVSVTPPQDVVFSTQETGADVPIASYRLRLIDAASGKELDDDAMRCLRGCLGIWDHGAYLTRFPLAELMFFGERAPATVVVGLPGFRPACMRLPEALHTSQREENRVEIQLRLRAGFGVGLVVLDAETDRRMELSDRRGMFGSFGYSAPLSGLAGARIISRDRVIGISDEQGLALCASDEPIEEFDVLLEGWTTLKVEGFHGHSEDPCGLGYVLMVRD